MNAERRTGEHTQSQGHEAYYRLVEGNLPEAFEPVEIPMAEGKWYEPILEKAREIAERIKGE